MTDEFGAPFFLPNIDSEKGGKKGKDLFFYCVSNVVGSSSAVIPKSYVGAFKNVLKKLWNVKITEKQAFPGCEVELRNPKAKVKIFVSYVKGGSCRIGLRCTGASSKLMVSNAINKVVFKINRLLKKHFDERDEHGKLVKTFRIKNTPIDTQNMIFTVYLRSKIRVESLAMYLEENLQDERIRVTYEPEIFSSLTIKLVTNIEDERKGKKVKGPAFNVFATGAIVVLGAKSKDQFRSMCDKLLPIVISHSEINKPLIKKEKPQPVHQPQYTYQKPQPVYQPQYTHQQPQPVYQQPQPVYQQPQPVYQQPQYTYQQPQLTHQQFQIKKPVIYQRCKIDQSISDQNFQITKSENIQKFDLDRLILDEHFTKFGNDGTVDRIPFEVDYGESFIDEFYGDDYSLDEFMSELNPEGVKLDIEDIERAIGSL